MLPFLSHFSISFELQCSAPLEHSSPVPKGSLQTIFVITRHGLRAPVDTSFKDPKDQGMWICDDHDSISPKMKVSQFNGIKRRYRQTINRRLAMFPPNCAPADLLVEGMQQHIELGDSYRQYLVDELDFLPWEPNQTLMEFRATKFERCQKSAQCFINGLYPPQAPGENFNILVGSDSEEFLYPDVTTCKEMVDSWNEFTKLPEYKERTEKSRVLFEPIYKYANKEFDDETWLYWGDVFSSYYCSNNTIPSVVTDEMLNYAMDNMYFMLKHFYNGKKGVAASPLWREIFHQIDEQESGKTNVKFHLYSSHDTTINGILSSVGYMEDQPPFRSHLAIEIWKVNDVDYVRLVFNGKDIPLNDIEEGKTLVKLSVLKEKLAPYLKFCLP